MALLDVKWDSDAGVFKANTASASATVAPRFQEIISASGSVNYQTLVDYTLLDVFLNGVLMEETKDYIVSGNGLTYSFVEQQPNADGRVRTRLYNSNFTFTDSFHDGDGVATEFVTTFSFTSDTSLDVYFNGVLMVEDQDWTREPGTSKIKIIDGSFAPLAFPNNGRLRVRKHDIAFYDQVFVGPFSTQAVNLLMCAGDKMDLYVNGMLQEEYNDWTRDVSLNSVSQVGGPIGSSFTRMRLRIW
jgi:hypothetical protein